MGQKSCSLLFKGWIMKGVIGFVLLLATVVLPVSSSNADPLVGSGSVSFSFTSYSGHGYAKSTVYDPGGNEIGSQMNQGKLNGQGLEGEVIDDETRVFPHLDGGWAVGEKTFTTVPISTQTVVLESDEWYGDYKNMIGFEPADFIGIRVGDPFHLGTFTYQNGIWFSDFELSFRIETISDDTGFDQNFEGILVIDGESNDPVLNPTPLERADYMYVKDRPDLGGVWVYEANENDPDTELPLSNVGTAELWGHIGSIELDDFRSPSGGAFLAPVPNSVPEPATAFLFGVGIIGLAGVARRKKR